MYIGNKIASLALPQLRADQAEVECEIGQNLMWDPNPDSIDKIIALYREADIRDKSQWPEYVEWAVSTVAAFRRAFVPRVKKLQLTAHSE